jgi:hypothetical protein
MYRFCVNAEDSVSRGMKPKNFSYETEPRTSTSKLPNSSCFSDRVRSMTMHFWQGSSKWILLTSQCLYIEDRQLWSIYQIVDLSVSLGRGGNISASVDSA